MIPDDYQIVHELLARGLCAACIERALPIFQEGRHLVEDHPVAVTHILGLKPTFQVDP